MINTKKIKFVTKAIILLIYITSILTYLILSILNGYFISKSPMNPLLVANIGLFFIQIWIYIGIVKLKPNQILTKLLKITLIYGIIISLVSAISEAIYYDIASSLLCFGFLVPIIISLYQLFNKQQIEENAKKQIIQELSDIQKTQRGNSQLYQQQTENKYSKKKIFFNKLNRFTLYVLPILVLLIGSLYMVFAAISAFNMNTYKPIGEIINIPVLPDTNSKLQQMRIYCIGQSNGLPTFLLQHGAGSNGLCFYQFQNLLASNGRRSCSYDRSGYGRSGSGSNTITPQQNAAKTYNLLNKIGETGPYILMGWSAGVQVIQIFNYYYPNNVSGMIFLDGYPNYFYLEAINQNQDFNYIKNKRNFLLFQLTILRALQPIGMSEILPNPYNFNPNNIKFYYSAYYRNMYNWNSQYNDIKNPNDYTSWLTNLGNRQGITYPYVGAKVNLNWPSINVKLLILPASQTVGGTNPNQTNIYYLQCLKYNQSAKSSSLVIIQGSHGVIYQNPNLVYNTVINYF